MKKLLAVSVVLVLLSSAAFAQESPLTFSGWGRGVFAPVVATTPYIPDSSGDWEAEDPVYTTFVGKWVPQPRVGISAAADWGNIGIAADAFFLESANDVINLGDNAFIWAKPWDFLKISVGKFYDDTLRGTEDDEHFMDYTLAAGNKDNIFTRFKAEGGQGALISVTPFEGLFIGALVNADSFDADVKGSQAEQVWKQVQIGVGYKIPDIGHARLGYFGGLGNLKDPDPLVPPASPAPPTAWEWDESTGGYVPRSGGIPQAETDAYNEALKKYGKAMNEYGLAQINRMIDLATGAVRAASNAPRIEAAFNLTAIENLNVDLGVKIPFAITAHDYVGDGQYQDPITVAVGANFTTGDFGIWGRIDTSFAGRVYDDADDLTDDYTDIPFALQAHLKPFYNLGFATVGLNIGLGFTGDLTGKSNGDDWHGYNSDEDSAATFSFGIGPWIQKDLSAGLIKAGLGFKFPTVLDGNNVSSFVFSVPIIVEFWF
jgi:hypothetical protein